jgi:hypothetical protein
MLAAFGTIAAPGYDPDKALFPHPTAASFDKDYVAFLVIAPRRPTPT